MTRPIPDPRRLTPPGLALTLLMTAATMPAAAQEPPSQAAPTPAAAAAPAAEVPAAPAKPPVTLMFSLKELMAIEQAIREGGLMRDDTATVETVKPRLRQPLYLSGIVYSGTGDWTIWLNGRAMRPGEKGNLFEVLDVTDRRVVLLVAWGETTRQVVLEPNQTFLPGLAQVVEGQAAL